MAQKKTQDEYKPIDELDGIDRVVIECDGKEHVARFTRDSVRKMERGGFKPTMIADFLDGSLTGLEDLVSKFILPAFQLDEPGMRFDEAEELFSAIEDKDELLKALMTLYLRPAKAIMENPTTTGRAKFRLV
ncbi:DUF5055 domain-containing protein [Olsenella phocaeensis]|uniref:DUF5055 domain-containing protein n=1 Tax=Olsenella phocaeensis TaxID=1852385 RepID=UPI0009316611|nr:DUF5055 domain-containing protein [Olsenella phocaeensis]